MKLVSFEVKNNYPIHTRLGVIQEGQIIDVAASYRCYLTTQKLCEQEAANRIQQALLPCDMVQFLEGGKLSRQALDEAVKFANTTEPVHEREKLRYAKSEVHLLSPIPRPRSLRDFLSFEKHIKNARSQRGQDVPPAWYEIPAYYKGSKETIIGPEDEVIWPNYTEKMDYELEMAVVIGKSGMNIPVEEADDYIAGYMILNDFSARDIQGKEMSIGLGPAKGKDFASALGPYLVTKDEIKNPYNLKMTAKVNGEVWSEGNSGTMHRTFAEIISYASQSERLYAGDVLGSGTVGNGCGLELGKFLEPGDIVELEIEQLGILRNKIGPK